VELAALLPFLLFLAVIATDWARLLYFTIAIESCARAGALYAADPEASAESPYADVTAAARGASPTLTSPAPDVALTAITFGSGPTARPGVQVTVSMPFNTITNFPGVPKNQTLSRTVQMRVVPILTN
jgi:Flp pilus assembly protein TadG